MIHKYFFLPHSRRYISITIYENSSKIVDNLNILFDILGNVLAEMAVVICEDDKKANLLLDQSPRCLRKLITIKEVSPSTFQRAKSRGVEILKFSDVEIQGAQKDHPFVVSIELYIIPHLNLKCISVWLLPLFLSNILLFIFMTLEVN